MKKVLLIIAMIYSYGANADSDGYTSKKKKQTPVDPCRIEAVRVCEGDLVKVGPPEEPVKHGRITFSETYIVEKRKAYNTLYLFVYRVERGIETYKSGNSIKVDSVSLIAPGLGIMRHTDSGLALGAAIDVFQNVQLAAGVDF